MAQALFEAGKHGLFVASLYINDAIASQSDMGNCRSKQVLPGDAPKDLAFGPRRDACRKQCRSSTVNRTIATASHLVQAAEGKASTRQHAIYCLKAERQHLGTACPVPLEPRYAITKFGNDGLGADVVHAWSFQRSNAYGI